VNPAEEREMEFRFALTNTGDMNDTYTLEVETPLGTGIYKDWRMEFETKEGARVNQISVPSELSWEMDCNDTNCMEPPFGEELPKNIKVVISLYVKVALDEYEGFFDGIAISATSDTDPARMEFIYFNLTVILPNIRLSDDPDDFFIEPDSGIEEDGSIDIFLRVYNHGDAETGTFCVIFYNGLRNSPKGQLGHPIALDTIENIPANSHTDIMVTWDDIPGGENDIYAYADKPIQGYGPCGIGFIPLIPIGDEGLVLESKENDNTASIDDVFEDAIDLRPDLTILDIEFESTEMDEKQTITVTIANVGFATAEANSAEVSVKAGGESLKSKDGNIMNPSLKEDIDAGDDITMEFKWTPTKDKNFTIKATVDHPDDFISRNDRRTEYVVIGKPPPPPPGDKSLSFLCITIIAFPLILLLLGMIVTGRKGKRNLLSNIHENAPSKKGGGRSRKSGPNKSLSPWICSRCGKQWVNKRSQCLSCGEEREKRSKRGEGSRVEMAGK